MSNSSIKYTEPASGTEIATKSFTEDSTTKHFERFITGYLPASMNAEQLGVLAVGTPSMADLQDATWIQSTNTNLYYISGAFSADGELYGFLDFDGTKKAIAVNSATFLATADTWFLGDYDTLGYDALYVNTGGTAPASAYTSLNVGSIGFNVEEYNEFILIPACIESAKTIVYVPTMEFEYGYPIMYPAQTVITRTFDAVLDDDSFFFGEAYHINTKGAKKVTPLVTTMPGTSPVDVAFFYGIGI